MNLTSFVENKIAQLLGGESCLLAYAGPQTSLDTSIVRCADTGFVKTCLIYNVNNYWNEFFDAGLETDISV